jgi:membrane-associated phospholipid phosphatase
MARMVARANRRETWLSIAMASSLIFAAMSLIATRAGVFDLDHSTHALVGLTRTAALHGPMEAVSVLGQGSALIPLIMLGSLLFWRHRRRWAVALPVVMAGTGLLQFIAKWAVDRPRPNGAPWGFPSGHSLTVLVLFGLVAYLLWTSGIGRRWRCIGVAVCVLTILAVGVSRLYLDMHWLSDVGGGFAVGLAYLPLAIWAVDVRGARASS